MGRPDLGAAVANMAMALFGIIAMFRGRHWMLAPEEQQLIGQTGAEGMTLIPESEKAGPWVSLGTCLTTMFAAGARRWQIDIELRRHQGQPIQHAAPDPMQGEPTSGTSNGAHPADSPFSGVIEQ